MSDPWVPTYFRSGNDLTAALSHNSFLGGGEKAPHHFALPVAGPGPQPWSPPVAFVLSAIGVKEVAARLSDEQLRKNLDTQASAAISAFIDDCGNGLRYPWRWPLPGPPPPPFAILSELALAANMLQDGNLREEVLKVAGEIAQKANGAAAF